MNFIECAWKVKPILEKIPEARDNDRLLIAEVWRREMDTLDPRVDGHGDYLFLFETGMLELPETITRCRRKLQETNKELRGESWDRRHGVEADVCNQLAFFDLWSG